MYAPDSIDLLQKSGIDFPRHEEIGISPNDFAELMITSGLVLTPETKWISFHRCVSTISFIAQTDARLPRSGYDFGYFIKLLTNESLPTNEDNFFELLKLWFPTVYDIKYMIRGTDIIKAGLQEIADTLGVSEPYPFQMHSDMSCRSSESDLHIRLGRTHS